MLQGSAGLMNGPFDAFGRSFPGRDDDWDAIVVTGILLDLTEKAIELGVGPMGAAGMVLLGGSRARDHGGQRDCQDDGRALELHGWSRMEQLDRQYALSLSVSVR